MYQQINMYQPVFRRQHKVFSAATLLQITGVAAVLLGGFYAQTLWTLGSLESTAASLASQYQQLETRFGILEATGSSTTTDVDDEIEHLQMTIEEHQALLDSISQLEVRDSHGFGEFFETLATRTVPGVWLTGIRLSGEGETEISGSALNPTLVPRYLQSMPEQPRFIALHRGSVHLERNDPDISFILSSHSSEEL